MPNFIETIKQVALDVMKESKPFGLTYGVVESVNPLVVRVDQKLPLNNNHLILTNSVEDYNVQITINGVMQNCTVHNKLKLNEKVMLLRVQGGQQYIVLDRA